MVGGVAQPGRSSLESKGTGLLMVALESPNVLQWKSYQIALSWLLITLCAVA